MKAVFEYWHMNAPGIKDPKGPFEIVIREHRSPTNGLRYHAETSTGDRLGGSSAKDIKGVCRLVEPRFARKLKDWAE